MLYITHSESDTLAFGMALGKCLLPGECVLLSGDLGSGKSVMARGIARALGVTGSMPSPSFTIMIPYEAAQKVYHFDLYRLADPEEFYAAGLDEYVGGDGICIVEWPEMADLAIQPAVEIYMHRGEAEDDRSLKVVCCGMPSEDKIAASLAGWRIKQ